MKKPASNPTFHQAQQQIPAWDAYPPETAALGVGSCPFPLKNTVDHEGL